jgi:hypothetical protein
MTLGLMMARALKKRDVSPSDSLISAEAAVNVLNLPRKVSLPIT